MTDTETAVMLRGLLVGFIGIVLSIWFVLTDSPRLGYTTLGMSLAMLLLCATVAIVDVLRRTR